MIRKVLIHLTMIVIITAFILWICHASVNFAMNLREAPGDAYELLVLYPQKYKDPILLDEIRIAVEDDFLSSEEWRRIYERIDTLRAEELSQKKIQYIEEARERLK